MADGRAARRRDVVDGMIRRLRDRQRPEGNTRSWLLALAAALFIGAMVLAVRALPDGELTVNWPLVAVTGLVGAPALLAMNAVEYRLSARVLGQWVDGRSASAVAIYGGAANLLPLPGTALVRLQALAQDGSGYKRAAGATVVVAIAWMGAAGFVGAVAAAAGAVWWLAAALLALGLVTVPVTLRWVSRLVERRATSGAPGTLRLVAELYGLETVMIIVRALRFWLVVLAFGLEATVRTVFILPVAGVLSSAMGFLPGGLGIRELLAGALSGANGDQAAVGVLISGLDRIVALPVLAAIALGMAVWERRHPRPSGTADDLPPPFEEAAP